MIRPLRCLHGILACMALSAASTPAANLTWTGTGSPDSNNWFNSANWSGSGNFPQDGDSVSIGSGQTVLLTNSTAQLADFTINTTSFTFTNWTTALRATNITVQASGGFTHALCA